jgi:5-methylthioadenosine/S-adenosylhomocysteine deaminase
MTDKTIIDLIVSGDYILTMDANLTVMRDAAIAVHNGKIIKIGADKDIKGEFVAHRNIGEKNRVVFPGLINTHTHAAMVYLRGIADDIPLKEWLEYHIWPAENRLLNSRFVSDAVELACLEMLKAGITTYNDMYFFKDAAAIATCRVGMRGVLGMGILDFPTKAASSVDEYFTAAERFLNAWKDHELIIPAIAPHALYTCSEDTLKRAKRFSEKHNTLLHIHLSETQWEVNQIMSQHNMRPVEYLDSIGLLNEQVVAAHCVWLSDNEIELLAKRKVNVSHCVKSNLKLASGIAPVVKMLNAGVKVTFGTDGAASNNTLDILDEMSLAAKLHKAIANDATALNDKIALLMATKWGAEALGLGHRVGTLEVGKEADLVVASLNKPHLCPIYDIYSHVVYALRASDVENVVVKGNCVIDYGMLKTKDEKQILDNARYWQKKVSQFH